MISIRWRNRGAVGTAAALRSDHHGSGGGASLVEKAYFNGGSVNGAMVSDISSMGAAGLNGGGDIRRGSSQFFFDRSTASLHSSAQAPPGGWAFLFAMCFQIHICMAFQQ